MKKVRMLIRQTLTHSIYRDLSDDEIQAIENSDDPGELARDYVSEQNIIDSECMLDEFEVIDK
ncbi:MAG: hypothetical protein MRK00_16275 [Nitrosomonas sp.]|nr:hypothetical protein [Nitrosomonas sp.]